MLKEIIRGLSYLRVITLVTSKTGLFSPPGVNFSYCVCQLSIFRLLDKF